MRIERFEDVISWQKARQLAGLVYEHSKTDMFARDFGLRDQIRNASVSIMSNIAEGFERGGDKEFIQFLSNAKGSCGEVRSQLYVALDERYIVAAQFKQMYDLSVETSRTISGFMRYLTNSALRGCKFK